MAIILPALLCDSKEDLETKINAIDAETFSVDIMDNTLTPTSSFHDLNIIKTLDISEEISFELDIMSQNPLPIIKNWANDPRTIRAIIHAEIDQDIRELIYQTHQLKLEVGIAILPKTQIQEIEHLLNETDMVLIRGNEPGYSGKSLDQSIHEKIKELRFKYPYMPINIDIGVNKETIPKLIEYGATHLSVNSAIYKTNNPQQAFDELKTLANTPISTES